MPARRQGTTEEAEGTAGRCRGAAGGDRGPAEQRDFFRGPEVYTLDPARPGILTLGNRPMWQR